ncbi:tyrosine phosphatase [Acrasis kona]|uniref:Tyrosine phosphatase n=1 Tax=Acrasis kona TaxID=1008807 RepID=A0AAW2Z642_9EUKA
MSNNPLEELIDLPDIVVRSPIKTRFSKKELGEEFVNAHRGPTSESNWLIPKRVLMSAYPGDLVEAQALLKSQQIIFGGINVLVCLQQEKELTRFAPYKHNFEIEFKAMALERNLEFIQFEIPDQHVALDKDVEELIGKLVGRYHDGDNILIHCWGGHGRTGTIAAILLGKLYNLGADDSLRRVQAVHGCRDISKSRAPQTASQFDQVQRILTKQ